MRARFLDARARWPPAHRRGLWGVEKAWAKIGAKRTGRENRPRSPLGDARRGELVQPPQKNPAHTRRTSTHDRATCHLMSDTFGMRPADDCHGVRDIASGWCGFPLKTR